MLPVVSVLINGIQVTFLVDSGAAHTVVKMDALPFVPKMSGRFQESINASGKSTTEQYTAPLRVQMPGLPALRHSVLLSQCCPVNLLGRDLMCRLGICLIPTSQGLIIEHTSNVMLKASKQPGTFVQYDKNEPLCVYQWTFLPDPMSRVSRDMLDKARAYIHGHADFMTERELCCIAHVHKGRDSGYDREWEVQSETGREIIGLHRMFWTDHRCAVSVNLHNSKPPSGSSSHELFQVRGSTPHVALAKGKTDQWHNLGPWVQECTKIPDDKWLQWGEGGVERCDWGDNTGPIYRKTYKADVSVRREVVLTTKGMGEGKEEGCFLTGGHPALDTLPDELWAAGKYDVGLVLSASPVVVTPKTDYRPCVKQYQSSRKRQRALGRFLMHYWTRG